ncbi:AbrB/MazE/SpoVT family DNA-binding domain-containing protein [Halorubrum amylolyticum]|uniref:AbrB/MazE/SpoVT family DNA-binding domain-containing protein n=1 Tax=Halorubrum amylolyticum TaxID=2508724 RepID=UPI001F50A841|nr:AbrB/MazE/SpoVT family DNA-binding domain-containing protein [Halorubrum amylolyticum]
MDDSEELESSDPGHKETAVTASVSLSGQVMIPEEFRQILGISTPGYVLFRETDDGSVVIEQVRSPAEMEGFAARTGEASTDKAASELLHEKRQSDGVGYDEG